MASRFSSHLADTLPLLLLPQNELITWAPLCCSPGPWPSSSSPYHRDSACHAVLSVFDGWVFPRRLGRLRADTCLISLCPPVHDSVASYGSWPHRAITPFLLLSSECVLEKRHRHVNHTLMCHVLCPGQRRIRAPGRELEPQASESDDQDLSPSSTTSQLWEPGPIT